MSGPADDRSALDRGGQVSVTEERDRVLAEDLELAIKAMSEGGEEFEFRWLIPQGLSYRSHQFWADGSSKEQFHGLSEREFGTILKATIAAAREQGAAPARAAREALQKLHDDSSDESPPLTYLELRRRMREIIRALPLSQETPK
jgi:hypothetical protein